MKNLFILASSLLTAVFALSSCNWDNDEWKSHILTGEWEGDFKMSYDYECHRCPKGPDGKWRIHTYYATRTNLAFFPDYDRATHGYGYQKDTYREGPYTTQYYSFNWSVEDGVVYLDYPHDEYLNVEIHNYRMHTDEFTGRFGEDGQQFTLIKTADYSDWGCLYEQDYYYYDHHDWYDVHDSKELLEVPFIKE